MVKQMTRVSFKGVAAALCAIALALSMLPLQAFAAAGDAEAPAIEAGAPVWCLFNPKSGGYCYTANDDAAKEAMASGYVYGGIAWGSAASGDIDSVPTEGPYSYAAYLLHNSSNSGEYFNTPSGVERDALIAAGWEYKGVSFYISSSSEGMLPAYRLYNPYNGMHFFTLSESDRNAQIADNWTDEGIGWYALPLADVYAYNNITVTAGDGLDGFQAYLHRAEGDEAAYEVDAQLFGQGPAYDALSAKLADGEKFMYDPVRTLMLDSNAHTDAHNFGTLTLSFPVGIQNDGRVVEVLQYHSDDSVTTHKVVVANGLASVDATDVEAFAVKDFAPAPTMTDEPAEPWSKDSATGPTFRSDAPFAEFIEVTLDGKVLDPANYEAKEGSTIVTLKPEYAKTLSAGEHVIGIVSKSGTAEGKLVVQEAAAKPDDPAKPGDTDEPATSTGVTMYRLYNPNSGEHFYTASTIERDATIAAGWDDEGEGWIAPSEGIKVYRLYNSYAGEHHYTKSEEERDMLVNVGWTLEEGGWYSDPEESTPLYRAYNPNAYANNHHYTKDWGEFVTLIGLGWLDEGIGWHGIK